MARTDHDGITDQKTAAFKRLRDAVALLRREQTKGWLEKKGQNARGSMYLGGYAVECKLKAVAMTVYRCQTLAQLAGKWKVDERDVYTHGLAAIAKRLPLWSRLRLSVIWPDFSAVMLWRPSWRYDPRDWKNKLAWDFLQSVQHVYDWLDRNH